ncbi:MAG TPA: uroporphyrinogen decarboxylase [Terriglobia bacterium]|nr:uroporphyrinogen decarboxylase [Terriglobia bacterium]
MKACRMEAVDATPVWLMRQAGRYLKEYRALRARTPFLELCKNPDMVAEVTVSATERIGADAAILFADLLLIAEPMGFWLEYERGGGPVITPALRAAAEVDRLREVEPQESLAYVFEAIRSARASLDSAKPLIGFAGAPFTLASYLIEGGASKNFRHTKTFMYRDPGAWHALMEYLTRNVVKYMNGQIAAGVQAIQVFDSWVGCLSPSDYQEFVAPHMRRLFEQLSSGVPVIHFGTGTGLLLEQMRDAGGNVIGLDAHVELDQAWRQLGSDVAVQGNMDPIVLYADLPFIRRRAVKILQQAAGRPGHIFNLGHGILPETPVENVIELVRAVHEESSSQQAGR